MRYYQQVVQDGETLLFACRLHWVVFLRAMVVLAVALLLLLLSAFFAAGGLTHQVLLYGGLLALALAPFYGLASWIRWYSTDIAVTDRRVIYKYGLITRRTVEMNVSKIETVDVDQGPIARLLNYGNVIIRGTGGSFEPLRMIGAPIALRNAILVG